MLKCNRHRSSTQKLHKDEPTGFHHVRVCVCASIGLRFDKDVCCFWVFYKQNLDYSKKIYSVQVRLISKILQPCVYGYCCTREGLSLQHCFYYIFVFYLGYDRSDFGNFAIICLCCGHVKGPLSLFGQSCQIQGMC